MDPSRDLMLIERTPVDQLDFASPLEGLGGKLGFDATRKIGVETGREWGRALAMAEDVKQKVSRRWRDFFPDATVEPGR